MTKVKNVFNRANVCHGLCAVALLGFSLSAGAISRGTDRARGQAIWDAATQGKTTTVGGGNGSMTVIAPYKPSTVDANGNVALQTGPGNVNVNGQVVPVSVSGTIAKGDIANAAVAAAGCAVGGGGVAGAVVCGGVALAIPIAMNWLANAGVRINPTTKELEKTDPKLCTVGPCYDYKGPYVSTIYDRDPETACIRNLAGANVGIPPTNQFVHTGVVSNGNGSFDCTASRTGFGNFTWTLQKRAASVQVPIWQASSISDAVGLMNNSRIPNADIVRELDAAGQAPAMQPQAGTVAVTGPASIQGPTTTSVTNNSTTNSTTTNATTTNNYTYNNNNVTNSSSSTVTTTTTAVKNADGTTTTTTGPTTTTTTNPGDAQPTKAEDPPTQCDKFPNSLGCAELDTPSGTIPKETKTVTFQAEDVLGGGQCPADVMTTLSTLHGRSVKVIDWQTFCGMALPLRALVMALASIMAFFIIMPGGVRE